MAKQIYSLRMADVVHVAQSNLAAIVMALMCLGALAVMTVPENHVKLGNIFFGGVPSLYNINLAQRFYIYAAYPLWGSPAPYAHYQLSRTYFIQGDLATALKEAEAELFAYPEHTRTHYILGLTYGYQNQPKAAIAAFSDFIEAHPLSWAARNDKAWLQFQIGDIEGAIETMEPLAGNLNPWIQNTWGTLLMNAGRDEEAREAFLRAQSLVADMSEETWGVAYPGNDPRVYGAGLFAMRRSIETNLALLAD